MIALITTRAFLTEQTPWWTCYYGLSLTFRSRSCLTNHTYTSEKLAHGLLRFCWTHWCWFKWLYVSVSFFVRCLSIHQAGWRSHKTIFDFALFWAFLGEFGKVARVNLRPNAPSSRPWVRIWIILTYPRRNTILWHYATVDIKTKQLYIVLKLFKWVYYNMPYSIVTNRSPKFTDTSQPAFEFILSRILVIWILILSTKFSQQHLHF